MRNILYTMCVLFIIPSYHARRVGRHGWNRKTSGSEAVSIMTLPQIVAMLDAGCCNQDSMESLELDVHRAAILVEMCPERLG